VARKPTDTVKLQLRFSEATRRRLERAAARNNRSMNTEIIHRLEQSLASDPNTQTYRDMRKITAHMAQTGQTALFGRPLTEVNAEINEKLDKLLTALAKERTEK
jgi:Arc-like DNA binding domain